MGTLCSKTRDCEGAKIAVESENECLKHYNTRSKYNEVGV